MSMLRGNCHETVFSAQVPRNYPHRGGNFERKKSGPKKQPKHKVVGRDIPGTSGTQTSGYPGQKLYAGGLFCCFRHGVAGMSRDLGQDVPGLEKLYARQLWADFSYPKKASLVGRGNFGRHSKRELG